jgi:60 kDa SS-A/Ro ribonucleoprotein
VKSEKNYFVGGFDTSFTSLNFRKNTPYSSVIMYNRYNRDGETVWPNRFGGTDASAAYDYAIKNRIKTDVFVFMTDAESWAGRKHPSQALKKYRSIINPNAKAIYISLTVNSDQITLVDPEDKMSYDIAQFTSETPRLLSLIADGTI